MVRYCTVDRLARFEPRQSAADAAGSLHPRDVKPSAESRLVTKCDLAKC